MIIQHSIHSSRLMFELLLWSQTNIWPFMAHGPSSSGAEAASHKGPASDDLSLAISLEALSMSPSAFRSIRDQLSRSSFGVPLRRCSW